MNAFPIVDAHVHFWDPTVHYYPWLVDEPLIPFRYGDYSRIRRRYLPEDYKRDAGSHQVVKTVYVEAEWDPNDPIGEMTYMASLRKETGWPNVAVGQAWLDRDDREAVLEHLAAFDFVRGVRQKPRSNRTPGCSEPGGMTDARWIEGFAMLAGLGLRFDLQTPWWHLHEAAALADRFPNTQIILVHAGLPADRSTTGIEGWKSAMAIFARRENVAVKISGIGQQARRWTVADNRVIVETVVELFGTDRCMFASNFPVDSICADLDTIFSGFRAISASLSPSDQKKVFHDNAIRLYDIR
jgi:predicted TIM-barrel fold metal-dependent hydrolase